MAVARAGMNIHSVRRVPMDTVRTDSSATSVYVASAAQQTIL